MSKLIDQIDVWNTQILLKKIKAWVTEEEGIRGNWGHIHFCDGLWQIRGDLSETFPTAVYDVVATGTSSWAVQNAARRSHKWLVTWERSKQKLYFLPEFLKCETCTLGSSHKHVTEQKCMYLNTRSYDDTMFLKYVLGSMHLCLGINIGKTNEIFKTTKTIIFKIRKI